MPKFWARDYLSEALKERRRVVESMSLSPPAHIEIVDSYAHKGEVDNVHCTLPWILLTPDAEFNFFTHGPSETHLKTLTSDLRALREPPPVGGPNLETGEPPKWPLEKYENEESGSESLFGDDEDVMTGASPFSVGLTQEIELAVDRVTSSVTEGEGGGGGGGGGRRGYVGRCGEEFPAENLTGWERNTTSELAEVYLEEHECSPHLSSVLSALPTLADLVARLKPKLISDPMVDPSTGESYTYILVSRSDLKFPQDEELEEDIPIVKLIINDAQSLDDFSKEKVEEVVAGRGDDPVLELVDLASPITESSSFSHPSTLTPPPSLLPPLPPLPSPLSTEEDVEDNENAMKSEEDLKLLVSEIGEETEKRQKEELHFISPHIPSRHCHSSLSTTTDFLQLNTADVSHDSEDSGIGHAVLESPCVPPFPSPSLLSSSSSTSSSFPAQLARLQPFPISPYSPHKLELLSPVSEERLMAYLQEDSRIFDNVLALKLPYTGPRNHLAAVIKNYKPLNVLETCCDVHPINLTGDCELVLPWDPLALSYTLMATAQRTIVCLQCPFELDAVPLIPSSSLEETFPVDEAVYGCEDTIPHEDGKEVCPGYRTSSYNLPPPKLRPVTPILEWSGRNKAGGEKQRRKPLIDNVSDVDLFIMLRTGKLSPEIAHMTSPISNIEKDGDGQGDEVEDLPLLVSNSTSHIVYLNREHQLVLCRVSHYASAIMDALRAHGLALSRDTVVTSLDPDDVKFFLKQQQKCLADLQCSSEEGVLLESCRLAASLYALVSLADGITHINIATGLRRFAVLSEKYEDLIGSCLDSAKQGLADLSLLQQNTPHPKLNSLVSTVNEWMASRTNSEEKAVVVVGNDFSTVSDDILDFLNANTDLKSCVFSFACQSPGDPLYLQTLEERLQYYDTLVVPMTSIVSSFPWEKVGLLVEYHSLNGVLFPDNQLPSSLRLRQWLVLNTVVEGAPSSSTKLADSVRGTAVSAVVMGFQYTLIASEAITNNSKLLQLLESRFNMVLISREYEPLKKKLGTGFACADLIVDQCTGVLVPPLSDLSCDDGVQRLTTRVAALSLQYQRLWILLFAQPKENYPYGGNVPLNLARLHASVAHYSPQQDDYQVKVICASDLTEAAELVRTISEETRKQNEGLTHSNWSDREWIADDMDKYERFLLGFPCFNSFSALLLLKKCAVKDLVMLSSAQLMEVFPWLPMKVAKFFNEMCHVRFQPTLPVLSSPGIASETSHYWQETEEGGGGGGGGGEKPTTAISLDDSLQYATQDAYSPTLKSERHPQNPSPPHYHPATSSLWSAHGMTGIESDNISLSLRPPETETLAQQDHCGLPVAVYPLQSGQQVLESDYGSMTMLGSSSPPLPSISLFPPDPQTILHHSSPGSEPAISSLQMTTNHFIIQDNLSREYYGIDPVHPRLLTSGMVKKTPNRRPIKSLDSDIGLRSPQKSGREVSRLVANDRAAAVIGSDIEHQRRQRVQSALVPSAALEENGENTSQWTRRVHGIEELMEFHARQSMPESATRPREPLFSDSTLRTMNSGRGKWRQKRPLSRSPIFDCQVPTNTNTISPQSGGDSSLFPSPGTSFGSVQLSPLRKRRLVYKKLSSSLNGQTKLAFQ